MKFRNEPFQFYLVLTIFTFFTCNSNKSGLREIKTFFPDKSIAEIYYVKNDSIKENQYISYYKNGNINSICFFRDNQLDSTVRTYYESGQLSDSTNYSKGYLFGEQFYFHENGQLKKYIVVDGFGDVIYVLKYDKQGQEISREGMAISPNIYCDILEKKVVKKGQIAIINFMCSTPPNSFTEVYYGELSNPLGSKEFIRLRITKNNVIPHEITFTKEGKYQFYFLGIIKDNNGMVLVRDSIYKEVKAI